MKTARMLLAIGAVGVVVAAGCSRRTSRDHAESSAERQARGPCYAATQIESRPGEELYVRDLDERGRVLVNASSGASAFIWDGSRHVLGMPAGFTQMYPMDMNDRGDAVGVAVRMAPEATVEERAFLWRDGVPIQLATTQSRATKVNERGHVALWAHVIFSPIVVANVFVWRDGVSVDLGPGTAWDLNEADDVAGFDDAFRPAVWRGGVRRTLAEGYGYGGQSIHLNERGMVAGRIQDATSTRSFRWSEAGQIDLGTLGGSSTTATGINERGEVIGSAHVSDYVYHAFLWDGALKDIGAPGELRSASTDVNDRGQVVGWTESPDEQRRPFVWQDGNMTKLPVVLAAGESAEAVRINQAGVIAGHIFTAPARVLVWTPEQCPDPSDAGPPDAGPPEVGPPDDEEPGEGEEPGEHE